MCSNRIRALLLALAIVAAPAAMAQTRTAVTGTVTGTDGIVWNTGSITATIVSGGGASFSLTPCSSGAGCPISPTTSPTGITAGGNFSMSPWANASILPASTTYTFTATITGFPPPIGTGPQTCTLTGVTLSGASQTVNLTGCPALTNITVSGGSVTSFSATNLDPLFTASVATPTTTPALSFAAENAPSQTFYGNCTASPAPPSFCAAIQGEPYAATYASPNCGAAPNCVVVHDDTQVVTDVTFVNTSSTITCPNSDCNFVAGDVGKIVFGVVPVSSSFAFGPLVVPQGTILTVNTAQSITVSTTANASSTAGGTLVWGSDDTADLAAAWTAAQAAGCSLILPGVNAQSNGPGIMLTSTGQFNTVSNHCLQLQGNASDLGAVISGTGSGTSFIGLVPNFSLTAGSCPGSTCFGGWTNMQGQLRNVSFTGFGNNGVLEPGCPASPYVGFTNDNYFNLYDVQFIGFGSSCANLTALVTKGGFQMQRDVLDDGFGGGTGFECSNGNGQPCVYDHCTAQDQLSSTGQNFVIDGSGAVAITTNCVFGPSGGASRGSYVSVLVNSGGTWRSRADGFTITATGVNGVQVRGAAYLFQDNFTDTATGSSAVRVFDGGKVYARDTIFSGATYGLECDNNTGGTNYFTDLGGNTFSGTQSINAQCQYFGSASITGTAQTAANITPSTGWGTSGAAGNGVSSVSGDSHSMQFTITAAGTPTLNPTIAVVFPTAYLVAPTCQAQQIGGTGIVSDLIQSTLPSTTGVTFTWQATAVSGSTYIFTVKCQ